MKRLKPHRTIAAAFADLQTPKLAFLHYEPLGVGYCSKKSRSPEQIAELVREFKSNELTQRNFSENREIAARELQASLKIVRRASKPQLMAVQIEAEERMSGTLD